MSCTENTSVKRLITRQISEEFRKETAHLSFLRVLVSDVLTSKIIHTHTRIYISSIFQ